MSTDTLLSTPRACQTLQHIGDTALQSQTYRDFQSFTLQSTPGLGGAFTPRADSPDRRSPEEVRE
jgi:hypothetical protein